MSKSGYYIKVGQKKKIIDKKCTQCKVIKPVKEFYKQSGYGRGYWGKCKECVKKSRNKNN